MSTMRVITITASITKRIITTSTIPIKRSRSGPRERSADSPSHANPADAFISPDYVARPKRMAVVKGEVEFIGNVFGRKGSETNTGAKRV
jgi:hypothetical protein